MPIRIVRLGFVGSLMISALTYPAAVGGQTVDGPMALDELKQLAGRWEGTTSSPDVPGSLDVRVIGGGSTVIMTEFPGTPHEMTTLYFLDGDVLRLKHFCSMGNQPEMELDQAASSVEELRFVFTGGTNLDAATDMHIHQGTIRLIEADRLESSWDMFEGGRLAGTNRFFLSRVASSGS